MLSSRLMHLLLFAKLSSEPVFTGQSPGHRPEDLGCKPTWHFQTCERDKGPGDETSELGRRWPLPTEQLLRL